MRDELAAELVRFRGAAPLRDDQAFLLLAEDPALVPAWSSISGGVHADAATSPDIAAFSRESLPVPSFPVLHRVSHEIHAAPESRAVSA
jgi:hypothetical protein